MRDAPEGKGPTPDHATARDHTEAGVRARQSRAALLDAAVCCWQLLLLLGPLLARDGADSGAECSVDPAGAREPDDRSDGAAGGRVLSVAVDPSDASGNTVYIGTTGGVFKSTNAAASSGAAFVPVTDLVPAVDVANFHINLVAVGAVTVQPGGTDVVLAGTGDPTNEPDSLYGTGILRSADGGNSWTYDHRFARSGDRPGAEQLLRRGVCGIRVEHDDAEPGGGRGDDCAGSRPGQCRVYEYGDNSASGLYYSEDAGQTWQLATIQDGTYQVLQAPGQADGCGCAGGGVESRYGGSSWRRCATMDSIPRRTARRGRGYRTSRGRR